MAEYSMDLMEILDPYIQEGALEEWAYQKGDYLYEPDPDRPHSWQTPPSEWLQYQGPGGSAEGLSSRTVRAHKKFDELPRAHQYFTKTRDELLNKFVSQWERYFPRYDATLEKLSGDSIARSTQYSNVGYLESRPSVRRSDYIAPPVSTRTRDKSLNEMTNKLNKAWMENQLNTLNTRSVFEGSVYDMVNQLIGDKVFDYHTYSPYDTEYNPYLGEEDPEYVEHDPPDVGVHEGAYVTSEDSPHEGKCYEEGTGRLIPCP